MVLVVVVVRSDCYNCCRHCAASGLSAKSDEEAGGGRSGDGGSMRYFNLVKYDYAEVVERRCVFLSYVNVDI